MDEAEQASLKELVIILMNERDRQYSQRFDAQEKAVVAALDSAKIALTKAELASEKRFDSINEFRATLRDQQATYVPRQEIEARFQRNSDRIDDVVHQIKDLSGQIRDLAGRGEGGSVVWGFVIGIGGIIIGALAVVMNFLKHGGGP